MRTAAKTLIALSFLVSVPIAHTAETASDFVARGRYVAVIGGCNDCHTPGYVMKNGEVPESLWLSGDTLGWQGPWGTTYATNLRLHLSRLTEEQWVQQARSLTAKPPMPWFNVRRMEDRDLRAFYRYVRSLGSPGKPAPAYVPPSQKPVGPVVLFPSPN